LLVFRTLGKKRAMTRSRKVLLIIAALAVPAYFLPITRDELAWWWAQSHGHSDSYLSYLSDWPQGRHAVEARLFCEERRRAETKMAQIRTATSTNPNTEAANRLEQRTRRDDFFWKRATRDNTIASYHDYLSQYPSGRHAAAARQKIQALGSQASKTNATPQ
jgi:hypothetical protein